MQFQPVFETKKRPILIAGPCSAETEEQVLETARALASQGIDLFRSGIWKPRTRPGAFEGVGKVGLGWLKMVKEETGLRVTTEVANGQHVELALGCGIDVLWIGARTTVNPFSVQELADALRGVDVPILIKNPVNADLKLWIGAIERIYQAGIRRMALVHRGFSKYGEVKYRNVPQWELPIEMKIQFPDVQMICDHSHICGNRHMLLEVAQRALDLNYDGLMTEVHPDPDSAWSDPEQQVTPLHYGEMVEELIVRKPIATDKDLLYKLRLLRSDIDDIDEKILELLAKRMIIAEQIGEYKRENNIAIYQPQRWRDILENGLRKGVALGLSNECIGHLMKTIHQESINHQSKVMNEPLEVDGKG
ncbi:MAG: bifunctional 3-deoxy-7-phosphoheptulonate synthase/chorismate mutase type II [Saprospiraceae bacterium]